MDDFSAKSGSASGGKKRVMSDIVLPSKNRASLSFLPPLARLSSPKKNVEKISGIPKHFSSKRFSKFKLKIIFLLFLILLAYGILSVVFAKMKVEITANNVSVSLNETLELTSKNSFGKLTFSEISLSDKRSGSFSSSQKRTLESKAEGIITVINKNSSSQVLVASTRFESPSGKTYRIEKGVLVPAKGSLDVKVVAQSAGAEFNEENMVDFTLPGFKEQNSPKFNTVYGKSKTKITGGFSGTTFVVGNQDIKNAKDSLLKEAVSELKQNLTRKTPEDYFLIPLSVKYIVSEMTSEPKEGQAGEKFTLNITGSAIGVIIQKKSLEKALGSKIPNYDSSTQHYKITNIEDVSFEFVGFESGVSDFSLKVSGIGEFAGDIDLNFAKDKIFEDKLKKSSAVLGVFPEASRVKISFRPFWLRLFPDTKDRIEVEIN